MHRLCTHNLVHLFRGQNRSHHVHEDDVEEAIGKGANAVQHSVCLHHYICRRQKGCERGGRGA